MRLSTRVCAAVHTGCGLKPFDLQQDTESRAWSVQSRTGDGF